MKGDDLIYFFFQDIAALVSLNQLIQQLCVWNAAALGPPC